ncbi:Npun_F0813 family protein [Alkalinema sp. FACHB-956]|uniref:Npun_F0813 family protein n=1 Tax=Alkalinema sp. FACHB-956 TaxID=2692768 RepID=UPI0016869BC9|nr:Npun_F0813 family protein [Alkalinema sp. FACHB-956]MBD2328227.1 hypothetical protein [Alkalinema sp. FACHB-956]
MFILKRQDVDISSVQHPRKDQKIPILTYQGMTFRLLNVFQATQEEEARSLWRELTDNQGKACVLLEEPERYSIWGKVRLDQLTSDIPATGSSSSGEGGSPLLVQACLLMLQSMYLDIEDLMGTKQGSAFQRDVMAVFQKGRFSQAETADAVQQLLTADPLNSLQPPPWQESQMVLLLQEMYRLGKSYFGNTGFTRSVLDSLQDLSSQERKAFLDWLGSSQAGALWK